MAAAVPDGAHPKLPQHTAVPLPSTTCLFNSKNSEHKHTQDGISLQPLIPHSQHHRNCSAGALSSVLPSASSASDFCCPTWEDNEVPPWPNQLKFSMLLGMQLMNLFLLQQPLPCSRFTGLLLLCVCLMKLMKLTYTDGCSLTQEGTSH